ncbi:MAG: chemotaxis protein CheB [Povalibacter sp.]
MNRDIIVIGGSAGALTSLVQILQSLDESLSASYFVALHLSATSSAWLEGWLRKFTRLPVVTPQSPIPIEPRTIYVARPDQHLLIKPGQVHAARGPRENMFRPSIDVLFRSAAVAYQSRTVAVLLSGELDDGTAGLKAVKQCGGLAIVQNPSETAFGAMPRTALVNVDVDHTVSAFDIAGLLSRLIQESAPATTIVPAELLAEVLISDGSTGYAGTGEPAAPPTSLSCPSCGGPLWKRPDEGEEYRCMVGHAFQLNSLGEAIDASLENALWAAVRMFEQRSHISKRMLEEEKQRGRNALSQHFEARVAESDAYAATLRTLLRNMTTLNTAPSESDKRA